MENNKRNLLKAFVIILFIGLSHQLHAQCPGACGPNLINNSSFELMTTDCDTMNAEIFTDYSQVQDWFGTACKTCPGNGSTPDYYNSSCTGASPTENCGIGTGSVGFFTSVDVGGTAGSNAREYVQTQLSSTLVAGQEYCATIQVKTSPASFAYVPTDGLGLWFTSNMIDIDVDNGGQQYLGPGSIVNASPQISNTPGNIIDTVCTTITGTFVANGTESWLVMGNFRPDNQIQTTSSCGGLFTFCFGYLIVDEIELVPICSSCDATIAAATPFCLNDPATNLTANDPGGTWSGTGITDPNNGTFDPGTAGIGNHQIIYSLTCGDTDTVTISVVAMDDASFNYSQSSYCINDADPVPTITGLNGGTFSINNAGTINTGTGQIDLSSSGTGTYEIIYTTNGQCPDSDTTSISVLDSADATINATGPFCPGDAAVNLTATDPGGIWSGTGITDANLGTFDPGAAGIGTHQIIYTISGTCGDADTIYVDVDEADDPSFSYAQSGYCINDTNPIPTITGLSGGVFTISTPGVINASTGEIDLLSSGTGNFTVSYTTNGSCPETATFNISIQTTFDATITAAGPFCANDASINLSAADAGGLWSGNGITDVNAGTFDPATAGQGTHSIIYTIAGTCGDADTIDIVVNAADIANISYATTNYCLSDPDPTANINGTTGGTFSIDNGGAIDSSTGTIDLAASGVGTFNVTYTTSGVCPDTAVVSITILDGGVPTISNAGPFCLGAGTVVLTASPTGGVWSGTGITDSISGSFDINVAGVGTHQITYTVGGNCGGTDTISIEIFDTPNISLPGSFTVNYGSGVQITPTFTGTGTFSWTPDTDLDCNNCEAPIASPSSNITYCVALSNGACSDTACTQVIVEFDCGEVVIPTAFSPGSGDENAMECVLGNCVVNMHLMIYDRWGELVFESFDQNTCWDGTHQRNGKLLNTGVFVYQLEADLVDGTSIQQQGNITLFR